MAQRATNETGTKRSSRLNTASPAPIEMARSRL